MTRNLKPVHSDAAARVRSRLATILKGFFIDCIEEIELGRERRRAPWTRCVTRNLKPQPRRGNSSLSAARAPTWTRRKVKSEDGQGPGEATEGWPGRAADGRAE